MKRFLLFSGEDYYAGGGMLDFRGSYDTAVEAERALHWVRSFDKEWWHIFDIKEMRVVAYHGRSHEGWQK